MASFTPGVDTSVRSSEPLLEIKATAGTPLPVGKHVFRLVVTDDAGNESAPAQVVVIVRDEARPTAVIDVIDPGGARQAAPSVPVPLGQAFKLTGDRSADVGGRIVRWTWTLLPG